MPHLPAAANPLYVDDAVRQSLLEMLGSATYSQLVEAFLSEFEGAIPGLMAFAAEDRGAEVAELAHKVAGSAAVLGGEGLRRHLIEIEHLARAGAIADCDRLIAALPGLREQIGPAMMSGIA